MCSLKISILYLFGPSSPAIPCNTRYIQLPPFAKRVPEDKQIEIGRNISFECQRRYNLTGGGSVECRFGPSWSHNSSCQVVDCGQPPVPANSSFTGMNFTSSHFVNYTCNPGYEQTSGGTSLQCISNGTWIGSPIGCAGKVLLIIDKLVHIDEPGYDKTGLSGEDMKRILLQTVFRYLNLTCTKFHDDLRLQSGKIHPTSVLFSLVTLCFYCQLPQNWRLSPEQTIVYLYMFGCTNIASGENTINYECARFHLLHSCSLDIAFSLTFDFNLIFSNCAVKCGSLVSCVDSLFHYMQRSPKDLRCD